MARTTTPSTIILHGDDTSRDRKDGKAQSAITPGEILDVSGTEDTGADDIKQVDPHDADAVKTSVSVALEDSHTGGGIDDDYSTDDHVDYKVLEAGDEFYGFVFDGSNAAGTGTDTSDNANISDGDYLVTYSGSGDNGSFRKFDSADGDAEGAKLVQAREDVDASAEATPQRIRLEVI